VLDTRGEAPRSVQPGAELGFFFEDTRYLAIWELTLNGSTPTALSHDIRQDGRVLVISMTNRDLPGIDGRARIPRDLLLVRRILILENDQLFEIVAIRNFDRQPHCLQLEHWVGSRFDDIFEVRGFKREARGKMLPTWGKVQGGTPETRVHDSTLRYQGLDQRILNARIIRHYPATTVRQAPGVSSVVTRLEIAAHGDLELRTHVQLYSLEREIKAEEQAPADEQWAHTPLTELMNALSPNPKIKKSARTKKNAPELWGELELRTNNAPYDRALTRSASDIRMLLSREEKGQWYPHAGIPWFSAPFGRDGIITALQLLPWAPEIAAEVLDFVFANLGEKTDAFTEEEPGKVFHELRRGEMARIREIPFIPYYGTVDATPLALVLLREYYRWTGDIERIRKHWPAATRSLHWMSEKGRENVGGFLRYSRSSPTGLVNQGWKDSHDSIMHKDGSLAQGPIALSEVQAYAWRAWIGAYELADLLQLSAEALEYQKNALALRTHFNEYFWLEQEGYPALALDGELKPCQVRSSNMGQCLWGGILSPEQARAVRDHLLSPALFSGLGIRTLADTEVAYNPMSYHNGSIWPHDNALILEGLRRYGFSEAVEKLGTALTDVLLMSSDLRIPELYCGFRRRGDEGPIPYEVACRPQAWAAGSSYMNLTAFLGLTTDGPHSPVVVRDPVLPQCLDHLSLSKLRVPQGLIDLEVRRIEGMSPTTVGAASENAPASRYQVSTPKSESGLRVIVIRS
jgi:glycogen debranching enzyme